jgi:hypothetical protein
MLRNRPFECGVTVRQERPSGQPGGLSLYLLIGSSLIGVGAAVSGIRLRARQSLGRPRDGLYAPRLIGSYPFPQPCDDLRRRGVGGP